MFFLCAREAHGYVYIRHANTCPTTHHIHKCHQINQHEFNKHIQTNLRSVDSFKIHSIYFTAVLIISYNLFLRLSCGSFTLGFRFQSITFYTIFTSPIRAT